MLEQESRGDPTRVMEVDMIKITMYIYEILKHSKNFFQEKKLSVITVK